MDRRGRGTGFDDLRFRGSGRGFLGDEVGVVAEEEDDDDWDEDSDGLDFLRSMVMNITSSKANMRELICINKDITPCQHTNTMRSLSKATPPFGPGPLWESR